MENTLFNQETSSSAIEKLGPAIDVYKKTFSENRERVDRALLIGKSITEVPPDEAQDLYANNFLVKANVTLESVKSSRLASTRILDDAKTWAMIPEKELEAEVERIKKLRNERARRIQESADEKAREIEMQKAYDIHRGQVKARMKEGLELGIAARLKALEDSVAKMFNEITLDKISALDPYLKGVKPSLKEDFFDKLLTVPFDQNIMSVDKFQDTKAAAKVHFDFAKTNAAYIDLATKTISKWAEKIPSKKLELERIAKASGEEAAKLQAKAEQARKDEEARRQVEQQKQTDAIKEGAKDEEAKSTLTAMFDSQQKTQEIAELTGTRKTKSFRLDPAVEADFVKLSGFLAKLVLHVSLDKDNFTGIFKRTKAGEIKLDDQGNPEYVEGIQYWLDQIKKVKYANEQLIPGLISTEKLSTVAKAPK